MSYLEKLTENNVKDALDTLIKEEKINTKGIHWTLHYRQYTFSPNKLVRKVGGMLKVDNVADFQGGIGPFGCITTLKNLGFELKDNRME